MYRATKGFILLDPAQVRLSKKQNETHGLHLTVHDGGGEQTYEEVRVRLAFPLTHANHLITFADKNGDEIGLLRDEERLDPESRRVLEDELQLVYFIPKVQRIVSIKEEFGVTNWEVETDRGRRKFQVRSRYDIRLLGGGRLLIRDMDGNRYEIVDYTKLDQASQDQLEL
ncbi:MAG TPA: DUF1854 domain-containing protein, partial [Limnochordia bacterium]|nr:DUF1854 domain-containing protein [Limnochordia bacterium]